jgi:protein involved in polysaccharide export with SLBB domain
MFPKLKILISIIAIMFSSIFLVKAQEVDPSNASDQQLTEAVEKAKSQGYSQQQIEAIARARGLSEVEISNLRNRIQDLQNKSGTSEISEAQLREELGEDYTEEIEELLDNERGIDDLGGRIFGSELFNNRNLSFAPSTNIPTPEDYILGPGDEIIIDIWGASEKTYQLVIGPEGTIKIPSLGPVYINGLQVNQASKKLISRLTSIYSGLNPSANAQVNTYAQVSLGRIRSIKVNIIGEVRLPGTYAISSLSTVLHALYVSGGISKNGSFRSVQVFRNGNLKATFDLYEFLMNGKIENNIVLKDQDLIKIPFYKSHVHIKGEIKRPAIYELHNEETLNDLIEYAGGLTDNAYTKLVTIKRKTAYSKKLLTIKSERFDLHTLESGDEVHISAILDVYENRVSINGAVWRPGEYELTDSLMLSELVSKAEGISSDAFMERGQIKRYNDDLTIQNIEFSVKELIEGRYDILLKPEDVVTIKSIFSLREAYFITVKGAVRNPGIFNFSDSLTVEDVIFKAGGFNESAAKSFVEVVRLINSEEGRDGEISKLFTFPIRDNLGLSSEGKGFVLEPFDLIMVRKSPFYETQVMVELEGEVTYPGIYALNTKYDRISDLIERAGGFTKEAYPRGGTLIRETEYFDDAEAAKVKKLRIQNLGKLDSTTAEGSFSINRKEAIAIKLDEINKNPGSTIDLILKKGDVISVPKALQTVRVRGEIYFPNNIIYEKKFKFKDYVTLSGGHTQEAKLTNSYVIYPNGSAKIVKNFLWFKLYPRVEQGSEIVVPGRPERRKLSPQEIIGITSGIGTIALIINNLTSK